MPSSSFFKDLKVVELASVLAGPSVGMFFAELGATVDKIENKLTGGDVTRKWRIPNEPSDGPSAYYASINFQKNVHSLNLSVKRDYDSLIALISQADIVISNFQPKVSDKLNVGYQALKDIKPDIIFLQLDGFSSHSRPAFDVVLQAETGWISMTGHDSAPAKMPVALIDVLAGHQLKEAALLAIIHKMKTGEGSFVNCNLEKTALSSLANQATNYLMNGEVAQPIGTLHPNIAPYGDWFTTSDNVKFVLAVGSEIQFEKLWQLLDLKESTRVNSFSSNQDRLTNRSALQQILQNGIGKRLSIDLFNVFEKMRIPYGEIKSLDKVLADEVAKSMILSEQIEGRNTMRLSSIAFTSSFLD